jgi:hypothetical protein
VPNLGGGDDWSFIVSRRHRGVRRSRLGVRNVMIDIFTWWRRREVPRETRVTWSVASVGNGRTKSVEEINAELLRETMKRISENRYFELRYFS